MNKAQLQAIIDFLKANVVLQPIFGDRVYFTMPRRLPSEVFLTLTDFNSKYKQVENQYMLQFRIIAGDSTTNPLDIKDYNFTLIKELQGNSKNIGIDSYQIEVLSGGKVLETEESRFEITQNFLVKIT